MAPSSRAHHSHAAPLEPALLAGQLLLERARSSVPRVLERDLTRALERRRVVQGTLMRTTIQLVSAGDYWPFAVAIRDTRREWWLEEAERLAALHE